MGVLGDALQTYLGIALVITGPLLLLLAFMGAYMPQMSSSGTAVMVFSGIYVTVTGVLILPSPRSFLDEELDIRVHAGVLAAMTLLAAAAAFYSVLTYFSAFRTVFA